MLLHRLIPRVNFIRPFGFTLSTTSDADNLTYENRKGIITNDGKNHVDSKYYPLLSVVRQRLAGSENYVSRNFVKL